MLRRQFLKASAAGLAARRGLAQTQRPNLLLIIASQWRAQAMPGSESGLSAPNLERLAANGIRWSRAYAAFPLAAPSRAAILTGRFPHACGVTRDGATLPESQATLSSELKRAGYRTGCIGLWELNGEASPGFVPPGPRRHGFDFWAAFNRGHRYYDSLYFRDRPEPVRGPGFEPDYQTALAIEFMERERASPFFLLLSWGPPHPPRTPPPRTAGLYRPAEMRLRENVPSELEPMARQAYADTFALSTALDENLGRLLAALERNGIADNTIVVFTSDSGAMLASQGLEGADTPFEESARVPLILRYPRAAHGSGAVDSLVSNVDLTPTLLSLCGAAVPASVQGQNLLPAHTQESIYVEGQLESADAWRMIVRGLDKLVVDRNLAVTHLFNLGQDPFELDNLARHPAHELRRDELKALLHEWMRRTEDRMDASGLKRRR
jgi:arylsulfatase A-like enzyme